MYGFKYVSLLLLFQLAVGTLGLGRDEVCKESCLWINTLQKGKKLPLLGDISAYHDGHVFCYRGVSLLSVPGLTHIFTEVKVMVNTSQENELIVTLGNNSITALSTDQTTNKWRNGTQTIRFPPYKVHCVGLVPTGLAQFQVVKYSLDAVLVLRIFHIMSFAVGLVLFIGAPQFSRNVPLFYGTGVTVGIIGSLLILLYIFSKFVPKKNLLGLGILAGGYTLFASFFYWFWTEALTVALQNWHYVAAYVIISGLISFAVLYRIAPPTNERTLNLIQWALQLVGAMFLYLAMPLPEVGVALVVGMALLYCLPLKYNPVFLLLSILLFPFACLFHCLSFLNPLSWFTPKPQHRFLTQEEYDEQGKVETEKALKELKEYCRSNNNFEMISELHDSKRFTSFLAGKDHVTPQERVDHEWSQTSLDDSSEDEEKEEEIDNSNVSYRSSEPSYSGSYTSSSDSPTFTHSPAYRRQTHFTSTPASSSSSSSPNASYRSRRRHN